MILTSNLSNPVTLNLFQGPFLGTGRSVVGQQGRAVWRSNATFRHGAQWTLKRVQGDDFFVGKEAA